MSVSHRVSRLRFTQIHVFRSVLHLKAPMNFAEPERITSAFSDLIMFTAFILGGRKVGRYKSQKNVVHNLVKQASDVNDDTVENTRRLYYCEKIN
jgi:hypothetical protein